MSNQQQLDKGATIKKNIHMLEYNNLDKGETRKLCICWCTIIQIKEKLENYAYFDEKQLNKGKTTI